MEYHGKVIAFDNLIKCKEKLPSRDEFVSDKYSHDVLENGLDFLFLPNDLLEEDRDEHHIILFGVLPSGEKIAVDITIDELYIHAYVTDVRLNEKIRQLGTLRNSYNTSGLAKKYVFKTIEELMNKFEHLTNNDIFRIFGIYNELLDKFEQTCKGDLDINTTTNVLYILEILKILAPKSAKKNFDKQLYEKDKFAESCRSLINRIFMLKIEVSISEEKKKPFKLYHKEPIDVIKITSTKLSERKKSLEFVKNLGLITFSDDTSRHYRKVFREHSLSVCSWINVKADTYSFERFNQNFNKHCLYVSVDIDSLSNFEQHVDSFGYDLLRDKSIVQTWDTESYSSTGKMTTWENKNDTLFMICSTFHFHYSEQPFLSVCIVDKKCTADNRFLIIECGSEKNVVLAFSMLIHNIQPEFISGFNDSEYDWSYYANRGRQFNVMNIIYYNLSTYYNDKTYNRVEPIKLSDAIFDRYYVETNEKIGFGSFENGRILKMSGFICIDCRNVFKKLYPNEKESSLNFYLTENKIELKEDMPYTRLFEIYKSGSSEELTLVGSYCVTDARRVQQLLHKRNIIIDKREVSKISFTSMFDGISIADGAKVRNLILNRVHNDNFICSNETVEGKTTQKYPGALVLPPLKKLVTGRPNFKEICDKFGIDYDGINVKELLEHYDKKSGKILNYQIDDNRIIDIFNSFEDHRPVFALDFSSLYPSLIMTYNFSPEYLILNDELAETFKSEDLHYISFPYGENRVYGWTIRHQNDKAKMGIYCKVSKELFEQRALVKKKLAECKEKLDKGDKSDDNLFYIRYYDSRQRAIKIFMNTLYGETGHSISPLFIVQIAGGITSAGQRNLSFVINIVEKEGYKVYYGDTDSCYISSPNETFYDIDMKYLNNEITKEEYWTLMVKRSFDNVKIIRDIVNNTLKKDNGTEFLKMSYEEVLFPVAFLGKKKYFGIPHEAVINFNIKDVDKLFIRGLELKKRGTSAFLKRVCADILLKAVSLDNTNSLRDVSVEELKCILDKHWDAHLFAKDAVYKPSKKNVPVQEFVERMKCDGIVIKENQRFFYIYVDKKQKINTKTGQKIPLRTSDKMELLNHALDNDIKPDIYHYIDSEVIGQIARFICYDDDFYDDDDSKSIDKATKYLNEIYNAMKKENGYTSCECNDAVITNFRKDYRVFQKMITNKLKILLHRPQIYGHLYNFKDNDAEMLWNNINAFVENYNIYDYATYVAGVRTVVDKYGSEFYFRGFNTLYDSVTKVLNKHKKNIKTILFNKYNEYDKVFKEYASRVSTDRSDYSLEYNIRNTLTIIDEIDDFVNELIKINRICKYLELVKKSYIDSTNYKILKKIRN